MSKYVEICKQYNLPISKNAIGATGENIAKAILELLPDYSSFHIMVGKTVKPFYLDMFVDLPNVFTYQITHFTINISLNNVNDYYIFMDGTKTLCSVSQFLSR